MDDSSTSQAPAGTGQPPSSQAAAPPPAAPSLPNLKALPYDEAREVMLRLLTYQKVLERELVEKQQQLASWQEKVTYAESKGDTPLAAESRQRLQEVQAEFEELTGKLETEKVHNAILRDQLAEMVPDAPAPQQQAQQASGSLPPEPRRRSDAEIERDFERHRIEDELSALKRRLGGLS